jgi:hypothetical protein
MRPRFRCPQCRIVTEHYYYPRKRTTPVIKCVPCKGLYMAKRYAADPERYKKAARLHRKAPPGKRPSQL